MTKKGYSYLLGLSLIAANTMTSSAQEFGPAPGDWEVTLGGNGFSDKDFEGGVFGLAGSIGYYINRNLEVSVRQALSFADSEDTDSAWDGSTRVALDWHFDLGRFRPFIGVNGGGIYGDTVEESAIAGLGAGVKHYVLEKTFIFGAAEYNWIFEDADEVDNRFEDGQFVYTVGIGFNF